MVRLGLFNFRNGDVLLVTGDVAALRAFGKRIQAAFDSGISSVAVHEFASSSTADNRQARRSRVLLRAQQNAALYVYKFFQTLRRSLVGSLRMSENDFGRCFHSIPFQFKTESPCKTPRP